MTYLIKYYIDFCQFSGLKNYKIVLYCELS